MCHLHSGKQKEICDYHNLVLRSFITFVSSNNWSFENLGHYYTCRYIIIYIFEWKFLVSVSSDRC